MTLGRFTNPSASDMSAGIAPPPNPIRQSDVNAVRENYGIASAFKPKGLSDQSLYSHSVQFVLDWWKRQKAGDVGAGGAGGAGTTPGGGGGSASAGGGLPDTAMGAGLGPSTALPNIGQAPTNASYMAPKPAAPTAPRVGGVLATPTGGAVAPKPAASQTVVKSPAALYLAPKPATPAAPARIGGFKAVT